MREAEPRLPYRVIQVMAGAPVGGIETFFFDAVLALAEGGIEQVAVVRPNAPYQIKRLRDANIRVVTTAFSPWFIFTSRMALSREIASFQPDIVQYWTGRAAMTAVPTKAVEVGWYGGYRDRWRYASCSDFIGITNDLVQHIRRQGVSPEHVSLVHTFADPQPAPPLDRAQFDTPQNVPLLLALARLHRDKALDILLEALATVPQAYLWIAGEGPERAALIAQTKRLNLSERVRFLGWRVDREALLATAEICVFPSREEPFGTVTIEAWAAGTPLIAAASQGPKAYVRDGINGLLVPIDDAPALASAMNRLISDEVLRKNVAAEGRLEYERNFTKEIYVQKMQALYGRLAGRAQRRASLIS